MNHSHARSSWASVRDAIATYAPLPGSQLIGASDAMGHLRRTIRRFASLPAPVLVTGETGSGKELVARALHDASPRAEGQFVTLNVAAIPKTLAASALFGHERGAFTGADRRHAGVFEQAHRGTLFLDEIGDLPRDLQAWLLRVLETGELRSLGARSTHHVDVRVVAATHADLAQEVRDGRFRADLYYRLAVLMIEVPPLRDRLEDLHMLATHLLDGLGLEHQCAVSPAAVQALALHSWPGNVRELRAVLLRAVAFASGRMLDAPDIVRAIGGSVERPRRPSRSRLDAERVLEAMDANHGNVSKAAQSLGVPRTTLRDFIRSRGN